MVSLSFILRKANSSYECGKKEYKLNRLLLMDDIKRFSKSEEQMDTLVRIVYVFNTDIGMEFGMKKMWNSCRTKEYKRRLRLVLESKLHMKSKLAAINTWKVGVLRYGTGMLQWKESELKDVDRESRKTMTMYGALHSKGDVDRLYIKSKEGVRSLMSVERRRK